MSVDAKVTWQGRMTFTGTADSGFTLPLGANPSVGGDNDGFQPMELLAIGLAGCGAMDVISILTKKRQDVTGFEVKVHAKRASEHPKVFTHAVVEYLVSGHNLDEAAVVRSIELSATRYCPAQAMLEKAMSIDLKYHIFEDQGEGGQVLVKSGVYVPVEEAAA
jgi:putative redox protein